MGAQGNAGGHDAFLTVNNYYYLTANRLCQEWQDAHSRLDQMIVKASELSVSAFANDLLMSHFRSLKRKTLSESIT
jgi:hypothetical protein